VAGGNSRPWRYGQGFTRWLTVQGPSEQPGLEAGPGHEGLCQPAEKIVCAVHGLAQALCQRRAQQPHLSGLDAPDVSPVSGNWRLTFRFDGADVVLVDYQGYH
jgi:hypothetical protein